MTGELVSDAERRATVAELRRHCTSGRLTLEEFDARAGEAYDARSHADLVVALRDLPALESPRRDAPFRTSSVAVSHHHSGAKSGRERTFGAHLISYLSIMALLIGIWVLTTPAGYFWPVWPALGWGVGLFAHGASAVTCRAKGDPSLR